MLKFMKYIRLVVGEKIISPYFKWLGLIMAGKGCYDWGRYDTVINGTPDNEKYIFVITKFQNFLLWIYNFEVINFIKVIINNISWYFGLPLKIVSVFIIILCIVLCIYIPYKIYIRYLQKNNNKLFIENYENEVINSAQKELRGIYHYKEERDNLILENKNLINNKNKLVLELDNSNSEKELLNSQLSKLNLEMKRIDQLYKDNEKEKELLNQHNLNLLKDVNLKQKEIDKLNKRINELKKNPIILKNR